MQALLRYLSSGLALFALATLGACAAGAMADSAAGGDDGASATGGTGGATAQTVRFEETQQTLMLTPGEMRNLWVVVSPTLPSSLVRFALVEFPGSSVADAALNLTETPMDGGGRAMVTLTAPSVPSRFKVRAMVGASQAMLNVEVQASGTATLEVEPSYAGGRRVTEWVAQVYGDERTCADLDGNPPEGPNANPMLSVTVPDGEPIRIVGVPVGPKLAVTLRAGHFAGGCSGVDGVVEGQDNSVLVTVTNRPIQLDRSEVVLRLGLRDQEDALAAGMESVVDAATNAVLGTATDDTEALLDAMQEEATASATCDRFENVRGSNGWDAALRTALGVDAAAAIRNDLGGWLSAGVPSLARDDAFVGSLAADAAVANRANLTLTTVASFPAGDAGFSGSTSSTWTADAHDKVVLGATLVFNPAALLVLAAQGPATMDEPTASTLAEALSIRGGRCEAVSAALVARGQGVGQSCGGCNVECTRLLCEHGVERLVLRASSSLVDEPAELRLAATGLASVGEQAELETLEGSWVGALDAANRASDLAGALSAD